MEAPSTATDTPLSSSSRLFPLPLPIQQQPSFQAFVQPPCYSPLLCPDAVLLHPFTFTNWLHHCCCCLVDCFLCKICWLLHPLLAVPLPFPLCEGTNGSVAIVSHHLPIHRCHNVACPLFHSLPTSISAPIHLISNLSPLECTSEWCHLQMMHSSLLSYSPSLPTLITLLTGAPSFFFPHQSTHIHSPIALKLWCPKATDKSSLSLNRSAVSYFLLFSVNPITLLFYCFSFL